MHFLNDVFMGLKSENRKRIIACNWYFKSVELSRVLLKLLKREIGRRFSLASATFGKQTIHVQMRNSNLSPIYLKKGGAHGVIDPIILYPIHLRACCIAVGYLLICHNHWLYHNRLLYRLLKEVYLLGKIGFSMHSISSG